MLVLVLAILLGVAVGCGPPTKPAPLPPTPTPTDAFGRVTGEWTTMPDGPKGEHVVRFRDGNTVCYYFYHGGSQGFSGASCK